MGKVVKSDDEAKELTDHETPGDEGIPGKVRDVMKPPIACRVNHKKVRRAWWTTAIDK